jgi:hypothetical protein
MKTRLRAVLLIALQVILVSACTSPPAASNRNAAVGNSNASGSPNQPPPPATSPPIPDQKRLLVGSIEVTSTPPRAKVLLILRDEGGASEPQSRGVTPTTIERLSPGKYTVHLELAGYRYFQKDVEVKENTTTKVKAVLKRE